MVDVWMDHAIWDRGWVDGRSMHEGIMYSTEESGWTNHRCTLYMKLHTTCMAPCVLYMDGSMDGIRTTMGAHCPAGRNIERTRKGTQQMQQLANKARGIQALQTARRTSYWDRHLTRF